MDFREHNRIAWNTLVADGCEWTIPVDSERMAAARQGHWAIDLTPSKPVPRRWFPELTGRDVLCLASGGGQQVPLLAAAGATVTVLDNSPAQLQQDLLVAERESLSIRAVEGDMADLSAFADASFDLIVHPCSNVFVPDVLPIWAEAFRVLRPGGILMSGCTNPVLYMFDDEQACRFGALSVKHKLPYSDVESLTEEQKQRYIEEKLPLEFSHTLTDLIGGQLDAGFVLTDFYEDNYRDASKHPLIKFMPLFFATRAVKPEVPKP